MLLGVTRLIIWGLLGPTRAFVLAARACIQLPLLGCRYLYGEEAAELSGKLDSLTVPSARFSEDTGRSASSLTPLGDFSTFAIC